MKLCISLEVSWGFVIDQPLIQVPELFAQRAKCTEMGRDSCKLFSIGSSKTNSMEEKGCNDCKQKARVYFSVDDEE